MSENHGLEQVYEKSMKAASTLNQNLESIIKKENKFIERRGDDILNCLKKRNQQMVKKMAQDKVDREVDETKTTEKVQRKLKGIVENFESQKASNDEFAKKMCSELRKKMDGLKSALKRSKEERVKEQDGLREMLTALDEGLTQEI